MQRSCLLVLALAVAVIGACVPAPTASPAPTAAPTAAPAPSYSAGDAWKRAADGMDTLFVPAGSFVMGSDRAMAQYAKGLCAATSGESAVAVCKMAVFVNEQPAHSVSLAAFWIDRTEVTNGQYQLCVQAGACEPPALNSSFSRPSYYGDPAFDEHPVVNVLWSMAAQYCAWAGARLPTEAEWEYAARGSASRIFPWGNAFEKSRLNYCDAGCALVADSSYNDGYPDTAPVGSFPSGASWMGALDLAGNAREWVNDWLAGYPSGGVENPRGPETGELKVPRGGSWYDTPDDVRSANRGGESLEYYRDNLGFRCARVAG